MSDFGLFSDFVLPDKILVLDTETTGLNGGRFETDPTAGRIGRNRPDAYCDERFDEADWSIFGDLVVEIGICEADLKAHTVREVYSSVVGYDISTWTDEMRSAWIFSNSDLTLDEVSRAKPFSTVRREVADLVKGRFLTTYNVQYDLDKFLYRFPWCLKGLFTECRDIMFSARDYCKLENPRPGSKEFRYPKLEYSYDCILENSDPAGIGDDPGHRAMIDAVVAAHVLLGLNDKGCYDPLDYSGRHGSI